MAETTSHDDEKRRAKRPKARDIADDVRDGLPPRWDGEVMSDDDDASGEAWGDAPQAGAWLPPAPFAQTEGPPFPVDALPLTLRRFVAALATETQTPPDLAAVVALGALAAACGKRYEVSIRGGWAEPLALHLVCAMDPGSRKSAVFKACTAPLREWERDDAARVKTQASEAIARRELLEQRTHDLKRKVKAGDVAAEAEYLAAREELDAFEVPRADQLVADDVTPEALAELCALNGGRAALLSAEGGIFDVLMGRRYSGDQGKANLDVFLKGHAGEEIRVNRKGKEAPPLHVKALTLTLTLAVQPHVIRGIAGKGAADLNGRGMLARLLYSVPRDLVGFRDTDPPPMPEDVADAYRATLLRILRRPLTRDESGEIVSAAVRLADDARSALLRLEAWREPLLRPGAELYPLREWAAKWTGAVARIACLLHLADNPDDAEPVPLAAVERAREIGMYFLEHARMAYDQMGADPVEHLARRALDTITALGFRTFTARDLYTPLRAKADEMERVLALLQGRGFVRVQQEDADSEARRVQQEDADSEARRGRPRLPRFEAYPGLFADFADSAAREGRSDR